MMALRRSLLLLIIVQLGASCRPPGNGVGAVDRASLVGKWGTEDPTPFKFEFNADGTGANGGGLGPDLTVRRKINWKLNGQEIDIRYGESTVTAPEHEKAILDKSMNPGDQEDKLPATLVGKEPGFRGSQPDEASQRAIKPQRTQRTGFVG